jgi:hypothetical protein
MLVWSNRNAHISVRVRSGGTWCNACVHLTVRAWDWGSGKRGQALGPMCHANGFNPSQQVTTAPFAIEWWWICCQEPNIQHCSDQIQRRWILASIEQSKSKWDLWSECMWTTTLIYSKHASMHTYCTTRGTCTYIPPVIPHENIHTRYEMNTNRYRSSVQHYHMTCTWPSTRTSVWMWVRTCAHKHGIPYAQSHAKVKTRTHAHAHTHTHTRTHDMYLQLLAHTCMCIHTYT